MDRDLRNFSAMTLLVAALGLFGSWSAAVAETVSRVQFEQNGGEPVAQELLQFNTQTRAGKEFDRKVVDGDIKRLFGTGYFSDVVASSEPQEDGTLLVTYQLRLRPVVEAVVFEGNQKFEDRNLSDLVTVGTGGPLNDNALRESANALRNFYRDKGYLDAEIIPELREGADPDKIQVVFQIKEALKLRVDDVFFEGNTVFSAWKLRHSIANQYSYLNWVPYFNFGLLDREELERDRVRLRDMYWDLGYLDFRIEALDIAQQEGDPEMVNLTFRLFEGEPYHLGNITVSGNSQYTTEELAGLLAPLATGEVFDYRKEQAVRGAILELYGSHGYADATCSAERQADYSTHEVDLEFVINEGRQYKLRKINLVGNEFTKEKVILRELVISGGEEVDTTRIAVSRDRLLGMDMFERVDTALVNAERLDEKDLVVNVQEKDAYTLKVGGGFSDVDSLFGVIEAASRNFDITNPSNYFRGGGQRVRLQGAFGIERAAINFDFTDPWFLDMPLRFDFSAYLRESIFDDWTEDRWGTRLAFSKKFFDDFTSATLAYKFEQVNVRKMDHHMSAFLRSERGREWVSQFSLVLDRNTLNSLTDPTDGYQVNLLGAISPQLFGSTESFYRAEAKGVYFISFFDNAIVWQIGGKIGVVDNFDSNKPAPLYERYFLGGGDTLRGFPYRTVSPLSGGDPMGGESMLLFTTEATHPIYGFVRGAFFVDAGGAWKDAYDFDIGKFNVGAGYGLRIKVPQVPVPIKLDLAYPIVNQQDNVKSKLRFHFNMGFSF